MRKELSGLRISRHIHNDISQARYLTIVLQTAFRSTIYTAFLIVLGLLLVSCNNSKNSLLNNNSDTIQSLTTQKSDITQSDMWKVQLLKAETADSLTTTLAALQYGGDILETTNEITPESGNTFLLLELDIEKTGTGRAAFSWSDAHIEDDEGNLYYRHPNDTFLTNLNIPRLKGTDIVLGHESGYVCFEIPKSATGLRFIADKSNVVINIPE